MLLAGNCRLVQACLDRDGHLFYRARSATELSALLTAAYGESIDGTPIHPAIERIAKLMTERNWPRAKLAALHLRLPELADTSAAARVLEADALLKVTASFDPDKHPRWPKGSQEGHGGEFRPADGGDLLLPVADRKPRPDPISEPDPSKLLEHEHHWLPKQVRESLENRGLMDPDAVKLLEKGDGATEKITQDAGDKSDTWRVHGWDKDHSAYNNAVAKLTDEFIEDGGFTPEKKMNMVDAAELLEKIKESDDPAIATLREKIYAYQKTQGRIADERLREFRMLPPRARNGEGGKASMPEYGATSSPYQAKAKLVETRVSENLLRLGLEEFRDYSFYDKVPPGHTFVGIADRKILTPDVIVACNKALAGLGVWSVRVGLIDPESRKFEGVAQTSEDHISELSREEWAIMLRLRAWQQLEAAKPDGFPSDKIEELIREMPSILKRVRKNKPSS